MSYFLQTWHGYVGTRMLMIGPELVHPREKARGFEIEIQPSVSPLSFFLLMLRCSLGRRLSPPPPPSSHALLPSRPGGCGNDHDLLAPIRARHRLLAVDAHPLPDTAAGPLSPAKDLRFSVYNSTIE